MKIETCFEHSRVFLIVKTTLFFIYYNGITARDGVWTTSWRDLNLRDNQLFLRTISYLGQLNARNVSMSPLFSTQLRNGDVNNKEPGSKMFLDR